MSVSFRVVAALVLLGLSMSSRSGVGVRRDSKGEVVDERVAMGYADSWVVELDGGKEKADAVAESHGFVNLGQVSNLQWCTN